MVTLPPSPTILKPSGPPGGHHQEEVGHRDVEKQGTPSPSRSFHLAPERERRILEHGG